MGRALLLAVTCVFAPAVIASGQEQLLTREQALKEIFPEAARTVDEKRPLSSAQKARLEHDLGRRIDEDQVAVTRVFDAAGSFRGYAVVTEEIGKYRPITFMVGVSPDFTVRDVAVMVYRESRGGDVKRKRFLNQYRRKSVRDPIDVNRDIINISGATISVRSMNAGVKRVLAELVAAYGANSPRLGAQPAR
ncbi:MAG TPA: FMN-binding protein [Gemmatimonadaceae bacterium]|nr:FMN-binding protein [Gemmatimonadaceae bacterium]